MKLNLLFLFNRHDADNEISAQDFINSYFRKKSINK